MKTSTQVGTLTALIAAMALVGCSDAQEEVVDGPSDDAQVITLSYAFFAPAQSFPAVQMEHWAKELSERTDGRVEVDLFPGGSLLTASNMYDGGAEWCCGYRAFRHLLRAGPFSPDQLGR